MGKIIRRTSANPELAFVERVEGEQPCSLTLGMNAKGQYVYEIKLYFGWSADEEDDDTRTAGMVRALADVESLDEMIREAFETPNGSRQPAPRPQLAEVPRD